LGEYQGHELLHFWELSRNPAMASMGVAKKLIDCARLQQHLYPKLKFATLNADKENDHAQKIYDKKEFKVINE
jgi:ribosomal protein S18 acetylase RimI-like enzyme